MTVPDGHEQTGRQRDQSPGFLTTSDHSYPRTNPLPVVGNSEVAADAEALIPGPLHEHGVAGFEATALRVLADPGITEEQRAALIEGARTRYGWTVAETEEWMERRNKA